MSLMPVNTPINLHNIVMCANFLCKKDGKYLLLKRSPLKEVAPNYLHMPGGKIDPLEDPLQAAQRELFEETGLKANNIRLEAVVTEVHTPSNGASGYQNDWLVFYFSGDYESGELLDTEEGELLWLSKAEINKEKMFASVREIIDYLLDEQAGAVFGRFVYGAKETIIEKHISVCER